MKEHDIVFLGLKIMN